MVLRALATATEIMVHRTVGAEAWGDGVLRPEWRPTLAEDRAARTLAISELCALIPAAIVEQKDAVALIQKTHWTLAAYGFDESLEALVSAHRGAAEPRAPRGFGASGAPSEAAPERSGRARHRPRSCELTGKPRLFHIRSDERKEGCMITKKTKLTARQQDEILTKLQARFAKNMKRHQGVEWAKVQAKLEKNVDALWSLQAMEETDGEPDVVGYDKKADEYIFCDCSAQSPKARRSICYDREALDSRKEHKPKDSAMDMADAMGVKMLREEQYRDLQKLGEFDTTTSSWVQTPPSIRKLGGALFCDRRFDTVFVYHNGAESYYGARGFRGALRVG